MTLLAHPGHSLKDHLVGTAEKAAEFARHFGGKEHARLAGMLHDLGKAEEEFQKRVNSEDREGRKEPHAHHGAALVLADAERGAPIWPVAFAVNGHHAGLHNRHNVDKHRSKLRQALTAEGKVADDSEGKSLSWPIPSFTEKDETGNWKYLPDWLSKLPFDARQTSEGWRVVDLYTRFLFSALVDADRLDTEEHDPKSEEAVKARKEWNKFEPDVLLKKLHAYINEKREKAKKDGASATVLAVRNEVGAACEKTGAEDHRIRSLTVPTGGGKTLASMLFALNYAKHHKNIRRVIVVIPYLSIIQQTALELKAAFGDVRWDESTKKWIETDQLPFVLEHHSQAEDPKIKGNESGKDKDTDGCNEEMTQRRYAAENWDAPIVVTTSVQFFDSIFSRSPGDARKLHNIAQSVIIFDEVQTLPPRLMQPILDVLGELTNKDRRYGCSIVLCTATQPALKQGDDLPVGLKDVEEINTNAARHFKDLERVSYCGIHKDEEPPEMEWAEVAAEMARAKELQGLAVVNTRKAARELFAEVQRKLPDKKDAIFHLSTWMYPEHRLQVLDEVRRRLDAKEPCFLVSTQCIEAGVDVDFPEVWRAYGPYDSIVQAAGRCNRNGRLKDANEKPMLGVVHVFKPKGEKPLSGIYGTATNQTDLLRRLNLANPTDPTTFPTYFRLLYQLSVPDECEIQLERGKLHFERVSELFRLIEDHTSPVLVRDYQDNGKRGETKSLEFYDKARSRTFFLRDDWRMFQHHIVNLQKSKILPLQGMMISPALDGSTDLFVLNGEQYYVGGLNGYGMEFSPDYSETMQI
ncbi:MAG: CRISPR-associated helicase Cas3' [Verrucomicrobia bacterium]|nr:CRISPR-associated helicase Cas3' [Verrucomicrobiota bacterium]MBU4429290.1 CRISPR-associated helicase Cas3' [Verrucomicrobiota bacterium]MBU4497591.1 CRISPR-associated helicase Cas3' [Verrucomicrobiota bacterium]MCG2680749.1 CRISPR-associated helicase Cas3' [Kiritimatiellia bacterium]